MFGNCGRVKIELKSIHLHSDGLEFRYTCQMGLHLTGDAPYGNQS